MAEVSTSPDQQQNPKINFLWPTFSQTAFRRLCEPITSLIEEDRKRYFGVNVPLSGVPFDELDEHAQGTVASYIYPLTHSLASFQREHGWDGVFDPANIVAIARDYSGRCWGRRRQYEELEAGTQALWEGMVKEALKLLHELHGQPQYHALKPEHSSFEEQTIASAIAYALSGGSISVDGMWTIDRAKSMLHAGGAERLRPEFRRNLQEALLPQLQHIRFYPVSGEFNRGREETARELAAVLEQAL